MTIFYLYIIKNWPKITPKLRIALECDEIFPEKLFFPHNIHKYFLKGGGFATKYAHFTFFATKKNAAWWH
jgi:hypothetical protein